MHLMRINGNEYDFDNTDQPSTAAFSPPSDAASSNYLLVLLQKYEEGRDKDLTALGLVQLHIFGQSEVYIPNRRPDMYDPNRWVRDTSNVGYNTYLYCYEGTDLTAIRASKHIYKAGVYPSGVKINFDLDDNYGRGWASKGMGRKEEVRCVSHSNKRKDEDVQKLRDEVVARLEIPDKEVTKDYEYVHVTATKEQLLNLTEIDAVYAIELRPTYVLC